MVKRIVVVDDEAHVRNVLAMKLRAAGFEVDTAIDGADGLVVISEKNPNLVITDLQMPNLTGLELAQQLRSSPASAHIPLLMITSRGDVLTPEQVATTNIQKMLDKPFSPRQVVSLVLQMVGVPTAG